MLMDNLINEFQILDRDNVRQFNRTAINEGFIGYALGADVIITGGEYGTDSLKRIVFRAIKVETSEQIAMVIELLNENTSNVTNALSLINNISSNINNINWRGDRVFTIWGNSYKSGIDSFIEDGIEEKLVQSRRFVNRKELDLIRKEIDLQMSGFISDETSVRIGNMLGANLVVQIGNLDNGLINIQIHSIETAQIIFDRNYTFQG